MGRSIHGTLPDEEVNWAFDRHPNKRIDRIKKGRNSTLNKTKSHANRKFAWLIIFFFERTGDPKRTKESCRHILYPLFAYFLVVMRMRKVSLFFQIGLKQLLIDFI